MKKKLQFRSIGARLTFWFFLMAILPLIMVNIAIYIHMVNSIKISAFNRIEAMRDLKVIEVTHWLNERIIDMRNLAGSDEIELLEHMSELSANTGQYDITTLKKARNLLDRYLNNHDDLDEIYFVSPNTAEIIVSTNSGHEGKYLTENINLIDTRQTGDVSIDAIHFSRRLNSPSMSFSAPVQSISGSGKVVGFLVAHINLYKSLYKMLLNRTGMGNTGETLIVNNEGIALNKLRWDMNTPLRLKMESQPAVNATLGKTGVMEAADYRGKETLAAYTYIPLSRWGFVAKQDLEEVYAPIYRLRKWMLAIVILTLIGVLITAFRVSRSISGPIKKLHKGSEIIGRGNLNHRVGTDATDEIGELSRTFDLMIETLKITTASRDDLNREMAERRHLEKMLLEFREHERRRIGHDLHDNLGQQLTAISYKTQGLENTLRKKQIGEAEDAARITALIEMAKTQVKSLSKGLSPILGNDEYSLMSSIVELAANSEKLFGIPCVINCCEPVPIYNEDALLHLFRIAQEAVTNAARHAKPRQIEISLTRENEYIILMIKDDGIGFALPAHLDGIGLEIMKYRARIINAALEIKPGSREGTVVRCAFCDKREIRNNVNNINA